jgi:N-methylhydantoinase A/oxoprolinase/acetone carboxylase beta subunit
MLAGQGVEAVAVSFLFSFLYPHHERRVAEIARERHPGLLISLSCEVDPAFREYERTVVTAFDAYIKPVVDRYLANLEAGLSQAKVNAPLQVMQSRGGVAAAAAARSRPVRLFLSGPAAGVIGGRMVGADIEQGDLITVDIGGTSSDIALIHAGKPLIRADGQYQMAVRGGE